MPPASLKDQRVCAIGVLLVAENDKVTCLVSHKALEEMLTEHGAKAQSVPNSNTTIIIMGATGRDKDYADSKKKAGLDKEEAAQADGSRKIDLTVLTWHEFCKKYKLEKEAKLVASTCEFSAGKSYIAPGTQRTRQHLGPMRELSVTATGEKNGLLARYTVAADLWPAE